MSAQVISFPTPEKQEPEVKEVRIVADCDEGFTRLANTLLEAICRVDLTARQMRVFMAVVRKTYGFQKKTDRMAAEQLVEIMSYEGNATHIHADIRALKDRKLIIEDGKRIGPNPTLSEWIFNKPTQKQTNRKRSLNKPKSVTEQTENGSFSDRNQSPQKKEEKPKENINKSIVGKPDDQTISEQVISYLNFKAGKRFKFTKANFGFINARLSEGFTLEDFRGVIDRKTNEWLHDPKRNQYLRPSTLFNSEKFDGYVNAVAVPVGTNQIPTEPVGQQYAPTGHQKPQSNREQVSDALTNIHDTDW